jgi:hypothetical protein
MEFQFFIGGYNSGHFEVVLKNGELHFFVSNYPIRIEEQEPTHIIPIEGYIAWQNLINYLDGLNWKRKYETDIMDGTQWELTFESEFKKMKCYGSNAFPTEFENFVKLLRKITIKNKIPNELLRNF